MGTNPMQKMKRNSILTGLTIGLVIGLVLCGVMYFILTQSSTTNNTKGTTIAACVLNKEIKSGTAITENDVISTMVSSANAPTDATTQVVGGIAKIDLSAGTIIGTSMLNTSSETTTNDLREQEYNMIVLPTNLAVGDFIDIRLQLPNGGDYIVISKKKVINCNSTTVWLNMYEEEIELMSNAIIEYYIMAGSKLYATTYTDPGIQVASTGTYVPNSTVSSLISANPNVKSFINSDRYSEELKAIRNNYINNEVNKYSDSAISNIENNMKEEIKSLKESRTAYFSALNSVQ